MCLVLPGGGPGPPCVSSVAPLGPPSPPPRPPGAPRGSPRLPPGAPWFALVGLLPPRRFHAIPRGAQYHHFTHISNENNLLLDRPKLPKRPPRGQESVPGPPPGPPPVSLNGPLGGKRAPQKTTRKSQRGALGPPRGPFSETGGPRRQPRDALLTSERSFWSFWAIQK